jgi:hypothetical protein
MPARDETLLFATNVRLTKAQRNYLAGLVQAHDSNLGREIRRCIDAAIDAAPHIDGLMVNDEPATLRYFLERFDIDVDELADVLARAELQPDA